MMDLPNPPRRTRRAKTDLTGAEIARALEHMGVSTAQVSRLTGKNTVRISRQLRGDEDGDLPLDWELVLFALYHHPELRTLKDPLDLPFEEWGIEVDYIDDDE